MIQVLAVPAADAEIVGLGPAVVGETVAAGAEAGVAVVMVAVLEAEAAAEVVKVEAGAEALTVTAAEAGVWARRGYTIEAAVKAALPSRSCHRRWKRRRRRRRPPQ